MHIYSSPSSQLDQILTFTFKLQMWFLRMSQVSASLYKGHMENDARDLVAYKTLHTHSPFLDFGSLNIIKHSNC